MTRLFLKKSRPLRGLLSFAFQASFIFQTRFAVSLRSSLAPTRRLRSALFQLY
jgi:hypothetical protein